MWLLCSSLLKSFLILAILCIVGVILQALTHHQLSRSQLTISTVCPFESGALHTSVIVVGEVRSIPIVLAAQKLSVYIAIWHLLNEQLLDLAHGRYISWVYGRYSGEIC